MAEFIIWNQSGLSIIGVMDFTISFWFRCWKLFTHTITTSFLQAAHSQPWGSCPAATCWWLQLRLLLSALTNQRARRLWRAFKHMMDVDGVNIFGSTLTATKKTRNQNIKIDGPGKITKFSWNLNAKNFSCKIIVSGSTCITAML